MENIIINKLKKWRLALVENLKKATTPQKTQQILDLKKEVDRAIGCLELCYSLDIQPRNIKKAFELPFPASGDFSEYRIIDDAETEDPKYWKEFMIDNEKIFLYQGDIILKKK